MNRKKIGNHLTNDDYNKMHVKTIIKKVKNEMIVKIGKIEHPMEDEHRIMWIIQVTTNKITRLNLHPHETTETRFEYIRKLILYAYCNKYGLLKITIE